MKSEKTKLGEAVFAKEDLLKLISSPKHHT
jgi:hypothetical protein